MSIDKAKEVLKIEAEGILALLDQIGPDFEKAIELIMSCKSRVIIAGIGKSGIIAQKIAATLNSTGTASFFLHPVEAMHGDLGIVDQRDITHVPVSNPPTKQVNYSDQKTGVGQIHCRRTYLEHGVCPVEPGNKFRHRIQEQAHMPDHDH